jgi:hypothetical protein
VAASSKPARLAGQPSLNADFPPPTLASAPADPIPIASLFLEGQYERVLAWIAEATTAFEAMAAGRYRRVPTLVLGQDCLQPWARGVIWDCRDPTRCVLCQPTSADTPDSEIPGGHLMNRSAFRRMAERNRVADEDIVATRGGGGIECRSEVSLDIVLAFHHAGLGANFEAGARVIDADVDAGFASQPQPHLPFVPTRLGPRNVVMQTRARRLPDGGIEEVEKPRATFDLGYGGSRACRGERRRCLRHESRRDALRHRVRPMRRRGRGSRGQGAHPSWARLGRREQRIHPPPPTAPRLVAPLLLLADGRQSRQAGGVRRSLGPKRLHPRLGGAAG